MTPVAIRRWAWIHKWSSLVCTVFMLLLCVTGLPLIYHHEIGHLLGNEVEAKALPADTPKANLDKIVAAGMAAYPGKKMMYMSQEADEPNIWNLTLGDHGTDENYKAIAVDARTAEVLPTPQFEGSFMSVMFHLHVDLYAGLWGKLFLGLMGLLLLVAIVSGVVLYAPFMRKLDFGTVRRERTKRTKWLDLHNLLGIVTLTWAFVVGATGMINTWADLMLKYWQSTELAEMLAPYRNAPPIATFGSMEEAVRQARAAEPGMKIGFIAFPGTPYSSEHHYGVFMNGNQPFTSRLYKPVLIDAQTARVTDSRELPWYLTALLVSQPLHFGDYGGPVMQFLWAALDVITIFVLGSGLYLWLKRGVTVPARAASEQEAVAEVAGMPALAQGEPR
ncbi:putative iron-regulated membrane protein [Pseudoduganella flava]|uniref:PepSY domain-containing protein n=1 Tax=Pseudoduganella flava TaxID=871742 RepID=A0A562PQ87_9BURK|nr:PepSY-associated TM helix domain-containing protein [Pseudoduganella flava]QGZ37799.1 PepSY domain-containing protein [Pseudoduganella flava]TWI46615.1 putative iron-regulated membrane protein [Pseudoduganella flava]